MTPFRLGPSWFVVAGFLVLGMLVSVFASVRAGGYFMALGLLAGAVMRVFMPTSMAPSIGVRSRVLDIAMYAALAVVVWVGFTAVKL